MMVWKGEWWDGKRMVGWKDNGGMEGEWGDGRGNGGMEWEMVGCKGEVGWRLYREIER